MKIFLISPKRNDNNIDDEVKKLISKEKQNKDCKQKILDYISLVKILASYGVIVLHINNFWSINIKNKRKWIIANLYESLFYYSVPFFVLCIGATLLNFNERYGLIEYNKKRMIKVFIPLVGWTIILYFYKVYILKNIRKENFDFVSLCNYFFQSKLYHIFDSLHIFLITYMFIPLLAYIEKSKKFKVYLYYFIFLLITQTIIPYLINLFGNKIIFIYQVKIGYLIYIFAGYIIHNQNFSMTWKIIIYILGIFSFLIHLIGTHVLALKNNKIIRTHKGYLNLPSVIYSCALFLFIKEYSHIIINIFKRKYINSIGSLTLGPFFMHLTIKETLEKFTCFKALTNLNILLSSLLLFLICVILSSIMRRIPIIKLLVP